MSETVKLNLPLLAAAQAQKHVTVNEALSRLDASIQIGVESRMLTEPPLVVTEGEGYLIAPGAEGAWLGHDGRLASFLNGGWQYLDPVRGWEIWVAEEALRLTFDGVYWVENVLAMSSHNAAVRAEVVEIDFTISAAGGFVDTGFVIPSHASVWGVTGRVLEPLTGTLTDWSLGVAEAVDRYGAAYGLEAGGWLRGITGQPVTYYEPTRLRLTANGGEFETGKVRLAVHLMQFDLPDGD